MRKLCLLLALLGMVALACGTTTVVTPTTDVSGIVAQTMAAYTVEALLTQAAVPSETPSATPSLTPSPTVVTPTSTPEENAPDPLPVAYTGVILNNGECFNFDDGGVSVPDQRCDVWLTQPGLFRQMNGAQLSGYVTLDPPTRTHCATGRYEPGDLAIQTDLYMCFITDEGRVGFIVVREYRGSVPFTGIVFDYWVFR
jgi:hypothetical protein